MMDLIIGLCFGTAAAVALLIMWRLAEQLRKEVESREGQRPQKKVSPGHEDLEDSRSDS